MTKAGETETIKWSYSFEERDVKSHGIDALINNT